MKMYYGIRGDGKQGLEVVKLGEFNSLDEVSEFVEDSEWNEADFLWFLDQNELVELQGVINKILKKESYE